MQQFRMFCVWNTWLPCKQLDTGSTLHQVLKDIGSFRIAAGCWMGNIVLYRLLHILDQCTGTTKKTFSIVLMASVDSWTDEFLCAKIFFVLLNFF